MSSLSEKITEVLNDEGIKNMITEEVDKLSEAKAKEIAQNYIDILEKEADKYLEKRVNTLTEKVSDIVEEAVKMFVNKYKSSFKTRKNELKIDAILESLSMVCKLAGVNAEMITEEVNNIRSKDSKILEAKIDSLKKLLEDESTESAQLSEKYNSDVEGYKNALIEKDKEIKRLNSKVRRKELENSEINEEKDNIAKLGVIAELKQGLSLSESEEFEKAALDVPFSLDKSYINSLTKLRDSITEKSSLNEVTENEDNSEVDSWYYKYI
jgi:hypothetical protein